MTTHPYILSGLFTIVMIALIFLDLRLFHRCSREISMKEGLAWSLFWIALALLFNLGIYFTLGAESALNFLAGFLLEKALSVDNLFVFVLIFSYFQVPKTNTHQILFWGILGAIAMRAIFIIAGIALVNEFAWILYVFGVLIIIAAIKLALDKDKKIDPGNNLVLKGLKAFLPITDKYYGNKWFVKIQGKTFATPLFAALIAIETTDLIFAMDSIPAIFGITLDPFIVYTSNIFAILGLRSLYFVLQGSLELFHHLHYGLAFILGFIGVKMLLKEVAPISIGVTLIVIAVTLALSVLASILDPKSKNA